MNGITVRPPMSQQRTLLLCPSSLWYWFWHPAVHTLWRWRCTSHLLIDPELVNTLSLSAQCHVEHVDGLLVEQEPMAVSWAGARVDRTLTDIYYELYSLLHCHVVGFSHLSYFRTSVLLHLFGKTSG